MIMGMNYLTPKTGKKMSESFKKWLWVEITGHPKLLADPNTILFGLKKEKQIKRGKGWCTVWKSRGATPGR